MSRTLLTLMLLAGILPGGLSAQDPQTPQIMATYFTCDPTAVSAADDAVQDVFAPILDRQVSEGKLTAWGWLSHYLGGPWSRAGYLVGMDISTLFDVLDGLQQEAGPAALAALNRSCPNHVDYIWTGVASSQPASEFAQSRPAAGYSTYWVCDQGREARADEIVTQIFAPIFDRHVAQGGLHSWSWHEHETGGEFRRLLVYDAADHKTMASARRAVIADLESEQGEALREFGGICSSHQDYMWNIAISHP